MERDIIQDWCENRDISLSQEVFDKMIEYAGMIHETNQVFNLTGLKTKEAILSELIIGSIDPLRDIIVPRGTKFIDIGTGAGIPGIALSIYFQEISGLLIESNHKKAGFVAFAAEKLGLSGLQVLNERAETATADSKLRQSFDWCFMRAFGKPHIALELGAPFIKKSGLLYIYAGESFFGLHDMTIIHAGKIGLQQLSAEEANKLNLSGSGIVFQKTEDTPAKYPRRYAVIKREAEKYE